jgi:hypothetical protein
MSAPKRALARMVAKFIQGSAAMAGSLAQITGIAVTAIVTLGADVDVLYAVPLGVFAGALATGFVAAADARLALRKRSKGSQTPSAGILLSDSSNSKKLG